MTPDGAGGIATEECFNSYDDMLSELGVSEEQIEEDPATSTRVANNGVKVGTANRALVDPGIIGIHYDAANFDATDGSIAIGGTVCGGGGISFDTANTSWNNRISSTRAGCPIVAHYDLGDPIPDGFFQPPTTGLADFILAGAEPPQLPTTADSVTAVQYSGGGAPRGVQPIPLLGAHGITGVADDMTEALLAGTDTVAGLDAEDVFSTNTSEIGSISFNANQIIRDAETLIADSDNGWDRVNVIAHSKGGLDTRAAILKRPDLFNGLVTLASPHGGAWLANEVCAMRQIGINFVAPNMGPCDGPDDGLYNLQTPYMEWFNQFVFEVGSVEYHALGSVCGTVSGSAGPSIVGCQPANLLNACPAGGDTVVCLGSAFLLTTATNPARGMERVSPVFLTNHTGMRTRCPALRGIYQLYAPFMSGLAGRDANCALGRDRDGAVIIAGPGGGGGLPPTLTSTSLRSLQSSSLELRAPITATADASGTVTVDVTGVSRITAHAGSPIAPDLQVMSADGSTQTINDTAGELGIDTVNYATADLDALNSPAVTLSLSTAPGTQVAVLLYETSGAFEPSVAGTQDGSVFDIEVSVPGATADTTVSFLTTAGSTPLTSSGASTFAGTLPITAGEPLIGSVSIQGTTDRLIAVSFATVATPGIIGSLGAERIVDLNNDGELDAVEFDVVVDSSASGERIVVADMIDQTTGAVLRASGAAEVAAGSSPIGISLTFDQLTEAQAFGPFVVTNVRVLGENLEVLDVEAGQLGTTTNSYAPAEVAGGLAITSLAGELVSDPNGAVVLRFTVVSTVGSDGNYLFEGNIYRDDEPDAVAELSEIVPLIAGTNTTTVDVPIAAMEDESPGTYLLPSLSAISLDDASTFETAGPVTVTVATATCQGIPATIVGTSQSETISGTEGNDIIAGLGGDDVINALGGDDIVCAGTGNDTVDAGAGNDTVRGNRGQDELRGGDGDDILRGNRGTDVLRGNRGADELYGGRGSDELHGGRGQDSLYGGRNSDQLNGGRGADRLYGNRGADVLHGGDGNDRLAGGKGNDDLDGGAGQDRLFGGQGTDACRRGTPVRSCE